MKDALMVAKLREVLTNLEPSLYVVRSPVGNLALMRDDLYVGYIDMRTGEVDLLEPDEVLNYN